MSSHLIDFTFRGLMATSCVKELQASGLLRMTLASSEEKRDQDLFAPVTERIRNSSLQMQRYYQLLYVFENLVRDLIMTKFKEVDGEEWFDKRANTDMKRKVLKRKEDEQKNKWHVGRNEHPIYYLDFGDLGLIIQNHWSEFKDFFENQTWVLSRIQESELTRNVIAHTNVLPVDEGERLERHLRDWLKQIG